MTALHKKPPLDEALLIHYGVKGMKWGVRKDRKKTGTSSVESSLNVKTKGVRVGADGSIEIDKGVSLQRLVRSNGESMPLKDHTFASVTDYDNAKYVKYIGGKGIFGGGRNQILNIQAKEKISAPPHKDATKMVSELMLSDVDFRKANFAMLGNEISKRDLSKIEKDPTGKTAQSWYHNANMKLAFSETFDPGAPEVQKKLREKVQAKGFNALRDENDFQSKVSKAPIIVFSPEKSLKVTTVTDITDDIRAANKAKLKKYKSLGKSWADEHLYD